MCHIGKRSLSFKRNGIRLTVKNVVLGISVAACKIAKTVNYQLQNINCTPFPTTNEWLGSTNSGSVEVAQKPYSSSAPRRLTWIIATSIRICNRTLFHYVKLTFKLRKQKCPYPPTLTFIEIKSNAWYRWYCIAPFIFGARVFGRWVLTHSLADRLLLGAPTCCFNTWTLLMVSWLTVRA